jgi:NAD(P)H-flavin reductase
MTHQTASRLDRNAYEFNQARIVRITPQTPDTNLYTFEYVDPQRQRQFTFTPGQFMLLSVFGHGEAPFGICSSPNNKDSFELCIRSVGKLTNVLQNLRQGSVVGLRGPFGHGWPMEKVKGKNIVIIGGGIGLVPLRPAILEIMENRDDYGKLQIMYGARCPEELLFKDELYIWDNRRDIEYVATVDRDDEHCWAGNIGVVTVLFDRITISPKDTYAFVCGPPIMYKFVMRELEKIGLPDNRIFISLERRMKCGVGHCSHCLVGSKFVCQDGPVFSYKDAKTQRGAV